MKPKVIAIGELLVEEKLVDESIILDSLSQRLGLPAVKLRPGMIDPLALITARRRDAGACCRMVLRFCWSAVRLMRAEAVSITERSRRRNCRERSSRI